MAVTQRLDWGERFQRDGAALDKPNTEHQLEGTPGVGAVGGSRQVGVTVCGAGSDMVTFSGFSFTQQAFFLSTCPAQALL